MASQMPSGWERALEAAQREARRVRVWGGCTPARPHGGSLLRSQAHPAEDWFSRALDLLKDLSLLFCPLAATGDQKAWVGRSGGQQGTWVSRRHRSGGTVEPQNPRVSRSRGSAGATSSQRASAADVGGQRLLHRPALLTHRHRE